MILGWVVAIVMVPVVFKLPHYAWATIKNLYLDLNHFGLAGTVKYRTEIKPSKETVCWIVDSIWDTLRKIPIRCLQEKFDKEEQEMLKSLPYPPGIERVLLNEEGIAPEQNTALL